MLINLVITSKKHVLSAMHILFPPNIWADFVATINSCESFHAKSNVNFGAAHPNIFVLLDPLIGIQSENYISYRSSATQPIRKPAEKEIFLREKIILI